MALLGDKAISDDHISDGIDDSAEESSGDSLLDKLQRPKIKDQTESQTNTSGEAASVQSFDSQEPNFYEQMDEFKVPDDAIGDIGSTSTILDSAMEGIISLQEAR